ncbi:MAG TPA: transketolase [Streptosporangiaceae bacterium]|nr:transketolase [Streptosporangiaceae bacterium]
MRGRFWAITSQLLDEDPRLAVVLADISADGFAAAARRHPDRVINVGIREQLLVSVAGGLALAGMRPIAHTFASFLVERPFEQIKLDLNHQGAGAVLVSAGASFDYSGSGRTHQSPGDVALLDTLPGWTVHIPGHPDEAQRQLLDAVAGDGLVYVRLSASANSLRLEGDPGRLRVLRTGSAGTVVVFGPLADEVIDATLGMDVTILYGATARPLDTATLRDTLRAPNVVMVEPALAGTSARVVGDALAGIPHRLLGLGVGRDELRHYGSPADHQAAHGLDARSLRRSIGAFLGC